MRLRGKLDKLMAATAPEIYRKHVTINRNGETVLYVRALNAIYGIMKAALLFYIKFVKSLLSIGFELNPYDPCVANKTVDNLQLTVVWHVDDLKVSHVLTKVVTRMADWLNKTYEQLFSDGSGKMKTNRGKIHRYLGMTLDLSIPGEVKVTMVPYILEVTKDFSKFDPGSKTACTPAADHLFKVWDDAKPISEKLAQTFHTFVAKSLFPTKRARPYIATAVSFLATRFTEPYEDDWKKQVRMIR